MAGFMLGVQLVIYPAFRHVGEASFTGYVTAHSTAIVRALALLAPAEVVLALWMFLDTPVGISRAVVFISGALLATGWVATGVWYAPLHGRLQQGYDGDRIELLIRTNWLRTLLWLVRAALAVWFLVAASSS